MRAAIICYVTREASAIGRYQIRSCRRSKHRGGHPGLRRALQRHAVTPTGRGSPMSLLVSVLFERELTRRGVSFSFDDESARYRIEHQGGKLLVSSTTLRGLTTVTAISPGSPLSSTPCSAVGSRAGPGLRRSP